MPPPPELDWDLWLGPLRWRRYNPAYCPGTFRWFLESGGGQIRDRGAPVQHDPVVHERGRSAIVYRRGHGYAAAARPVGLPGRHGGDVSVSRIPAWTLVWGQPGEKLGKLEFGNVFWGRTAEVDSRVGRGVQAG